ncbi:MAG: SpoIIE family protein phosphatase [Deltaproteobacteria bacterium]|nr:SpoIIE family protein phosphatase [Deltaproteobacteria bacterium]
MPETIKTFDVPDAVSALLVPGRKKSAFSMPGDALLIDPARGILAVADGSERNPAASSAFLTRFALLAEDLNFLNDDAPLSSPDFERIVGEANDLVRDTTYNENTTFSAFIGNHEGGAILHTGDSLIFLLHRRNGITQLSRSHHLMVGRAPRLSQAEMISVRKGDLVLLATDGLTDLARCHGLLLEPFLRAHVRSRNPQGIAGDLKTCIGSIDVAMDDIGCIAADPSRLRDASRADGEKVILGWGRR